MDVTTKCVQVMGSYGYSKEYPVEKYMRDAKIVQIFLGPNELLSQLIGASL
jgi:butyryl-CoA dehydrogenase